MRDRPSTAAIDRFAISASRELQPQLESVEQTAVRLTKLRRLAILAGNAVHLDWGLDIPHPDISDALLTTGANLYPSIEWLAPKIEQDTELGCWLLPLKAEHDSKNRAKYPTISSSEHGAKGELAHRFVVRRMIGPLVSQEYIDHLCHRHACCNLSHLDIVTHTTNVRRGAVARGSMRGQTRLF